MNANQAFTHVREAAIILWTAVIEAGAAPPFSGDVDNWIKEDRDRVKLRELMVLHDSNVIRGLDRAYHRSMNNLIKSIAGLVKLYATRMAKRASRACLEVDDLIQEGYIGVFRAAEKFDAQRGTVFNTYAHFWIYQAMNTAVLHAGIVRVPKSTKRDQDKAMRSATYLADFPSGGSSDHPDDDASALQLGNILTDGDDSEKLLTRFQDEEYVVTLLSRLTSKQVDVLTARFWGERTLAEIGQEFGQCRERIRQIEQGALSELRYRARDEKRKK